MFADFEPGFGLTGAGTTVFVRRNGIAGPVRELCLPPGSKVSDLLEKSGKALDIDMPLRAFHTNGVQITDMENVEQHEVIHISCGEAFKATEASTSGSQIIGNFMLQEKLGQGGFGSVYKGVHMETGETAAIKFVPKNSFQQISDLQRVFQEIQALRNLRHPNVIRILDVAEHPESICFIMEFASGGELRAYVEKRGFLHEDETRHIFKQVVRAVHYMHQKKTIHRDLKLENILLDASQRCKIVDFGLSGYVAGSERTVTDAGTEAYLAPEVYNGSSGETDPYKIDVWALGVILYALAHGTLPFRRPDAETCAKLDGEGFPTYREELSSGYRRLVKAQLTVRPHRRMAVDQIALDSWVTNNRFAIREEMGNATEDSDEFNGYQSERQARCATAAASCSGDALDEVRTEMRSRTEPNLEVSSPEPLKAAGRRTTAGDGEALRPPRARRQGRGGEKALVAAGAHVVGPQRSMGGPGGATLSRLGSSGLAPASRSST